MKNNLNFDFKDGTLYVSLIGEINHHSAVFVRQEIDEKIQELRPQNLVLDLADAPFIDSSGLGLIMGRCHRMKELGGTLTVANPSAGHQKIFELAGLNKLIKIKK
jgi:stage II sporulation protein AA (anti-sigma F factor antagonist)